MISESLTHGNAYTSDPDYGEFFGAPKPAIVYDWTYRRWMRCTVQSPKTSRDSVPAVNPDMQLEAESWGYEKSVMAEAVEAVKQARRDRGESADEALIPYLREHGPSYLRDLIPLTPWVDFSVLRHHMRMQPEIYRYFAPGVWGLVGQEYKPAVDPNKLTGRAEEMRKLLRERGPMTVKELADALPMERKHVDTLFRRFPNAFCVVEVRPKQGNVPATRVWGLVEE